ncbi:MAG TPA: M23 family metallopeptidase [Nevskiaceae bacterium]
MDIILVNPSSGKSWRLRQTRWHLALGGACVLLLAATLLGAGYWLAGPEHAPDRGRPTTAEARGLISALHSMQTQVAGQQGELERAKAGAEENVNALARRLAQLQADVMRLNAAAQRMVEVAHIDAAEFRFDQPPAVGGPDLGASDAPELRVDGMDALDRLQAQLAERQREFTVLEDILRTSKLRKETQPEGWPVDHGYISSSFGSRTDPFTGHRSFHSGIDIAGPDGGTVRAVAAGIVVEAGAVNGYGELVRINHGNGVETLYGHNQKILVHVGQKVLRGQSIALEGSTGRSTGPHSHFEVRIDERPVNPLRFLQAAR